MTTESLKLEIKSKFRTISRFAEISGIPERDIRYLLSGKMSSSRSLSFERELRRLSRSIKELPDPRFITDYDRETIRGFIALNFRSIRRFSNEFPEFSVSFVSNIVTGRRKLRTERFEKLRRILSEAHFERRLKKPLPL
jgi:hypothetical protein